MSEPDLFGDSVIEQALKQNFDDLSEENSRLSDLCEKSLSTIDELELTIADLRQTNDYLKDELELTIADLRQTNDYLNCQLSLVQEELLAMFANSSDNEAVHSFISKQNRLILHQISLLQNILG